MYKCTSATVTVHICTVTVTSAFNILVFFGSVGSARERGSEEIIKNCKIMNILLNKYVK